MTTLTRSDQYRERMVHLAQRRIWEQHTYAHRQDSVLQALGMSTPRRERSVSVIVSTVRPEALAGILENFGRQNVEPRELHILGHGFEISREELRRCCEHLGIDPASVATHFASVGSTLGENLNRLCEAADGEFIVRMDDDDWYGENYSRDLLNAWTYSGAELVGKSATYVHLGGLNATILTYAAHENRFTKFVRGATFASSKDVFTRVGFPSLGRSEDSGFLSELLLEGGRIYSADRFNFVVTRNADLNLHTWGATESELLASGTYAFSGNGRDQVSL